MWELDSGLLPGCSPLFIVIRAVYKTPYRGREEAPHPPPKKAKKSGRKRACCVLCECVYPCMLEGIQRGGGGSQHFFRQHEWGPAGEGFLCEGQKNKTRAADCTTLPHSWPFCQVRHPLVSSAFTQEAGTPAKIIVFMQKKIITKPDTQWYMK